MLRLFVVSLLMMVAASAQAAVNMRNGAYTESWIDHIEPGDGFDLRVERFYSSRSLFNGLFGFGWCSSFETFLDITSDGILNLTECGGGLEVTYYPEKFEAKSTEQTIQEIVRSIQKEKKLSPNDIKNLETQLNSNTRLRFQYANQLHLIDIKKIKSGKNTFHASSRGLEQISFDGRFYERKRFDGSKERFNQSGQLVQITNPVQSWIKLQYQGKKLLYIVDNKGRRLNFSYATDGKLARIANGQGLTTHYKFSGSDLIEVTNIWKKTYRYEYDAYHNLTSAQFPDGSRLSMSYDLTQDWIRTYTNRRNCRETYNFTMSQQDPKNNYWSTVEKVCENKKVASGRHEFWYKPYSFSTEKYLHRVKEEANSDLRDIYFHPFLGRAVSARENDIYQGFAYFLNGLLNKREFKRYTPQQVAIEWTKSTFGYDPQLLRLISAEVEHLNANGKTTKTSLSQYEYNSRGLLQKVINRAGESVLVSYEENGRISSIKNHRNIEIHITYNSATGRPVKLKQTGLGEVEIRYDTSGEIASIVSDPQRQIASSVVESFLSMIEQLGPAGESLKF